MSIRVMTRVWDHAQARGGTLLVLLALADFANDDGVCWPKLDQLAKKARLSDRQVRTALRELEAAGAVATLPGRGRGHRSEYLVLAGLSEAEKGKINPEKTSPIPRKRGSLRQLKGEVYDISRGDLAPSEASNEPPNRHVDPSCITPPPQAEPVSESAGGGGERSRAEDMPAYQQLTRLGVGSDRARALAPRTTEAQIAYLEQTGRQKSARDLAGWVVSGIERGIMPPPATSSASTAQEGRPYATYARRPGGATPAAPRPREQARKPPTPEEAAAWLGVRVEDINGSRYADMSPVRTPPGD